MTRVLVLGGAGFLGRALIRPLVALGHEVTVFDRFSRGSTQIGAAGARPVAGDFADEPALAEALRDQQIVLHFLASSSPAATRDAPLVELDAAVRPSVRMLELAVEAGVGRMVLASSGGAVYGDVDGLHDERTAPHPISPYGIGKLTLEHHLEYFRGRHGLASVSLRISNPYGPGQRVDRPQGLIPIVLARARAGQPVELWGDGSMVRDYVHVDDLVRMTLAVALGDPRHGVYNIGAGVGHSVLDVLQAVRDVTGLPLIVEQRPQPAALVQSALLDVTRYSDEFDDRERVTLLEGIERTWRALQS